MENVFIGLKNIKNKNLTGEFNTLGYSEKEYNSIRVYFNLFL